MRRRHHPGRLRAWAGVNRDERGLEHIPGEHRGLGANARIADAARMQSPARKLKYHVAMTLDGFIAREDDSTDFFSNLSPPDHVFDYFDALGSAYDTVVMGRSTYEVGLKVGVTDPYPSLETHVCSRSWKESPDPRVHLVRDNLTPCYV